MDVVRYIVRYKSEYYEKRPPFYQNTKCRNYIKIGVVFVLAFLTSEETCEKLFD